MSGAERTGGGVGDPGTSETGLEEMENIARATAIDAIFAEAWSGHLEAACRHAVETAAGEDGLAEACRRAFREGFHTGAAGGTRGEAPVDTVAAPASSPDPAPSVAGSGEVTIIRPSAP